MAPKAVAKAAASVASRLRSRGKAVEPEPEPKSSPSKKRKVTFDEDEGAGATQGGSKVKKAKATTATPKKAKAVASPKKTAASPKKIAASPKKTAVKKSPAKKSPVKAKSPKKSPVKTVTETTSAKKSAKVRVEVEIPLSPAKPAKAATPEPKTSPKKSTTKPTPKVKSPKKTSVKAAKGKSARRLTIDVLPKGKSPKKAATTKATKSAASPSKLANEVNLRKLAPEFKQLSDKLIDFADKVPPIVEAVEAIKHLLEQQAICLKALVESHASAKALEKQKKAAVILPAQLLPELTDLDQPWKHLLEVEHPEHAQLMKWLTAFTRHGINKKAREARMEAWQQQPETKSTIERVSAWLNDRKFVGEPPLLSPTSDFSFIAPSSSFRPGLQEAKTSGSKKRSPSPKAKTSNKARSPSKSPARSQASRKSPSPARTVSPRKTSRTHHPALSDMLPTIELPDLPELPASPVRAATRARSRTPNPSEPPKQQLSPRKVSSPKKPMSPKRAVVPGRSTTPSRRTASPVAQSPKKPSSPSKRTASTRAKTPQPRDHGYPPVPPMVASPRKASSPAKQVSFTRSTTPVGSRAAETIAKPSSPKKARSPSKQIAAERLPSPSRASSPTKQKSPIRSPGRPPSISNMASPRKPSISTRARSQSPAKAQSPAKSSISTRSHPQGLEELTSQMVMPMRSPSKGSPSRQRPLLEPASPLKSKSPIPGVAVEELRATRKASSPRKASASQTEPSSIKAVSPRKASSPSKIAAPSVLLSPKKVRSTSEQLSPGKSTTWVQEPWQPKRKNGRPLSPEAFVPTRRKDKQAHVSEDIDALWGSDTAWPENPPPEFPDFKYFETEYIVRDIDGTPLHDMRTKLPYNKVDQEVERKYSAIQRAIAQFAAVYCDYNVSEKDKKVFLSTIRANALKAFVVFADKVASSGPKGKEGWQELMTVKPLRIALVIAMINSILKDQVFECPMFGGTEEQEKEMKQQEDETADVEGFESSHDRAILLRKLLDEQKGGFNLPSLFRQRVVEVVCAIFTLMEPLIGPHHFPEIQATVRGKLFEDLVTIVQKTGELSLVMKGDLESVYTLQPVFKDMPFDEKTMIDLRNIVEPMDDKSREVAKILDEYLDSTNPKPRQAENGSWTDKLSFLMGKDKPLVRIVACDELKAYRKGGWRDNDAEKGYRHKTLGKARVVTRYGVERKLESKDGKPREDDGFRTLRDLFDKKEFDKVGSTGLFGSWFG